MTHAAKHTFALVVAIVLTAATFHETTRVPAEPVPVAALIA